MCLGKDKKLKALQKELKKTGADMTLVRDWISTCEKVKRNYPKTQKHYYAEREKLKSLQSILKHMESCFIAGGDVKKNLQKDVDQLKKVKEDFGHEFLVDKGNSDFALTFSRLKKMSATLKKHSAEEMLFLHSETENLSDMTKEILEKEIPNMYALSYFSLAQNDSQLAELPYEEKIKKIERIYEREFLKSMRKILSVAIEKANDKTPVLGGNKDKTAEERIDYILEDWIWN